MWKKFMCGKSGCGCRTRRRSGEYLSTDSDDSYQSSETEWPLWKKVLVWSIVSLAILIFLAFILVWVVIPVTFMLSVALQRLLVFFPFQSPKNPDFDHPEKYGITGVRNFYITVSENSALGKIGAWLILPEALQNSTITDVSQTIRNSEYDIALYLHGVYANRAKPIPQYGVMRKHFLVIAIDHRGYGDSGENLKMTEEGIISDHLQIYDWVKSKNTTKDIYYWGHSLGAAISIHTVRALKEQKNEVPRGLILESAFSNLAEEVINVIIGKIFKWLPYFHSTVLNPLDNNGFRFYSTKNILQVDCPIMMMHAEDDGVVPVFLGARLADVAKTERDLTKQGNVTFYQFDKSHGYGHNDITKDPAVPGYVKDFKQQCQAFNKSA